MSDEVRMFEGNCALKKMLGRDFTLGEIESGKVEACQDVIDKAAQMFFARGVEEVAALEALVAQVDGIDTGPFFEQAGEHAHNLRGAAELLGFTLIASVSQQMVDSIERSNLNDAQKRRLVGHITVVLRIAFDECIRDSGGEQGQELLVLLDRYLSAHGCEPVYKKAG